MFIAEEQKIIKRVNEIIKRDPQLIDDTVNTLISKGVPNGAFQDYALCQRYNRVTLLYYRYRGN